VEGEAAQGEAGLGVAALGRRHDHGGDFLDGGGAECGEFVGQRAAVGDRGGGRLRQQVGHLRGFGGAGEQGAGPNHRARYGDEHDRSQHRGYLVWLAFQGHGGYRALAIALLLSRFCCRVFVIAFL